jgi:hypothetical protein
LISTHQNDPKYTKKSFIIKKLIFLETRCPNSIGQLTHKNLAELIDFSQVNIFFSLIKNLVQTKLQTLNS